MNPINLLLPDGTPSKVWACGECKMCSTCKTEKQASEFYGDKRTSDGLKSQCKNCHNSTSMLTRDPENHRDANRKWMRESRYRSRPGVRERRRLSSQTKSETIEFRARVLVGRAVDRGVLERPDHCPECGQSELGIHAHHEDYTKPLDVVWLCSECHGKRHRKS